MEKRHLHSSAAVAFLSGISFLSVYTVQKDGPHLHYKYHSFNGLAVGKSTKSGRRKFGSSVGGARACSPLNPCGYRGSPWKDLRMRLIQRFAPGGQSDCSSSDHSDPRASPSRREHPVSPRACTALAEGGLHGPPRPQEGSQSAETST